MTDTANDQHGGDAPQYDHYEIVERIELSEDAVEELADALSGHSLIQDRTYGGYMIARHHREDEE